MAETSTAKTKEKPKPQEGERFSVMIPPALWARVEPLMEKLFLGKTNFACQAFDLFVAMQDKDPVP